MFGESPCEDIMEGVLEQRSERSSGRRRIPPLKGMWYKVEVDSLIILIRTMISADIV